jgi:hypothetical protein
VSDKLTLQMSYEIARALKEVLNASGKFWVQASERDGLDEERMTVSYGGDDGPWFELIAYLQNEESE